MNIVGISGSLKRASTHTTLLHYVRDHLPDRCHFELLSIDLPLYNEDLEGEAFPVAVTNFKRKISHADALIIASPEYNHSVSGPLKNTLDWASRPAFDSPLKSKPVAIISASPSPVGGARGQAHLRTILSSTLSEVYPAIEYLLGNSGKAFDQNNVLVDEQAISRLTRFINGFIEWVDT